MGRRFGSKERLGVVAGLNEQEWEMTVALMTAFPDPVPYDRCHHLSVGCWASPAVAGNTAHGLRKRLGYDAVVTVKGSGYRAGRTLLDRLRKATGGR